MTHLFHEPPKHVVCNEKIFTVGDRIDFYSRLLRRRAQGIIFHLHDSAMGDPTAQVKYQDRGMAVIEVVKLGDAERI
jgi:hypothetical protein